jgi:hypothetical protein
MSSDGESLSPINSEDLAADGILELPRRLSDVPDNYQRYGNNVLGLLDLTYTEGLVVGFNNGDDLSTDGNNKVNDMGDTALLDGISPDCSASEHGSGGSEDGDSDSWKSWSDDDESDNDNDGLISGVSSVLPQPPSIGETWALEAGRLRELLP